MNIVERYYELADDNITGKERVKIISKEFPEIGTRLKNSCNPLDRRRGIIRADFLNNSFRGIKKHYLVVVLLSLIII